jgi:hypothetical protein
VKFHVCDYFIHHRRQCPSYYGRARQLYRIESLHPPGHHVLAVALRGTIEKTRVFTSKNSEFCPYSLARSVGLSKLRFVIFLNGINLLPFVS